MTAQPVNPADRFTRRHPCPICGGWDHAHRGQGDRCYGYLSADGQYAHCTREDHADSLPQHPSSGAYAHRLAGNCRCGVRHDPHPDVPPIALNRANRRSVATYDYQDAAGAVAYQVVRYDPKDFRQRRPDGRGGWHWTLGDTPRVLCRLPELLATDPASIVYYCEGEKDTDAVAAQGLVATTNSEGAGKLRREAAEALRGRRVVILPHNDQAGQDGAEKVAATLAPLATEVRVLLLPGLPEGGGDVSDWLAAGGDAAQLAALADAAPPTAPPTEADIAPFPVDVLPGAAGQLVREGAAALDVDPAFIAVPLLVLTAGALGNRYCLELKRGYRQYPILYAAVVGAPGSGKTPAADLARAPLDRLQHDAWLLYRDTYQRYQAERATWEALPKQERASQPPPEEPVLETFFTTDATMEALGRILGQAPGLTYYRDELVGWVKACDQYRGGKGNDRQKWLEGWSKTPWKIDRKTGPPLYIPHPAVSVVGSIQPDVLPELQHEAGARDGFIERILWSYPAEHFPDDTDDEVSPATSEALYRLFAALCAPVLPPVPHATAATGGRPLVIEAVESVVTIPLAPDARSLWKSWHRDNTRLLRETTGLAQGLYAKLPNQAARLALVLHCLAYYHNPAAQPLDAATLSDALELAEYFRAHALRVLPRFGQAGVRGTGSVVGQVAAILDQAGGAWVARSAIRDRLHRNPAAETISAALAGLAMQGRAEQRVNRASGTGRPPEEWRSLTNAQTRKRENAATGPTAEADEEQEWTG